MKGSLHLLLHGFFSHPNEADTNVKYITVFCSLYLVLVMVLGQLDVVFT